MKMHASTTCRRDIAPRLPKFSLDKAPKYTNGSHIFRPFKRHRSAPFPHHLANISATAAFPSSSSGSRNGLKNTTPAQETTHPTPTPSQNTDGKDPFVWTRCWYPLTAVDNLDPSQPTALTLLGTDVVIWRDSVNATWRCFRDSCPHRAAPLSEGIINPRTGALQCSYHGWQFEGSGSCVDIPQSDGDAGLATALTSKRSCCASYPTAIAHGLLWVWMESGKDAAAAAAKVSLPSVPEVDGEGRTWFEVAPWYIRELEVDYLPLMENSGDPSHVHFTHAGFIGAPDRAGPITVHEIDPGSYEREGVYHLECDDPKKASFRTLDLRPPCMLWAASEDMKGGELALLYFVVPIAPGRSRLMSMAKSTNKAFRFPSRLFHWLPFLRHLFSHEVAAQDAAILHRQGTNMSAADFPGWKKGFYLPTKSDGGVSVLRKWLEGSAGGGVAWGPNVDPAPRREAVGNRSALFDNYHQHTKNCPHCLKALKWVNRMMGASIASAMAFAARAAWMATRGVPVLSWAVGVPAVGAVLGALLWAGLSSMRQKFYYTDWTHAKNKKLLQI